MTNIWVLSQNILLVLTRKKQVCWEFNWDLGTVLEYLGLFGFNMKSMSILHKQYKNGIAIVQQELEQWVAARMWLLYVAYSTLVVS